MKIGEGTRVSSSTASMAVPYRTGDVVVVQTQRIVILTDSASQLMLKFPNGDLLTTELKNRYPGKQGDLFTIKIHKIENNRIYAELVTKQLSGNIQSNSVASVLARLDIPLTQENYQIVTQMLGKDLILSKDTFGAIARIQQQYPQLPLEQIVFMLKHKIPLNEANGLMLMALSSHENLLGDMVMGFIQLFFEKEEKNKQLKSLVNKFYKNPGTQSFGAHEIKEKSTMNDLFNILQHLQGQKSLEDDLNDEMNIILRKIQMQYEILKHMQPNPSFLQIPANINGNYSTVELYVMRDEADDNGRHTAFIRIPTANIGTIELYMVMDMKKGIEFHFRAEECKIIQASIINLYEALNAVGFRLTKVTYNQIPTDISFVNFETYTKLITQQKTFDQKI